MASKQARTNWGVVVGSKQGAEHSIYDEILLTKTTTAANYSHVSPPPPPLSQPLERL